MMAMPRRRIHAEYAMIAALMSTASSVVSGAQLPVTTWLRSELAHSAANEPMHQVTAYWATDSSKPGTDIKFDRRNGGVAEISGR